MERKHKITVQTNYKLFLPMLFAVMILFFGCQNKEDKKQELKNVEVIPDTSAAKSHSLDTITNRKTLEQTQSPTLKVEQVPLKKNIPTVSGESTKDESSEPDKAKKENPASSLKPFSSSNAEFPGGIDQFHTFFMKEYKKPENVNYWKLNFTLAFAVEKNGSVSFLECSPAVEEPLEKEIIRVLSLCPKWHPGESNGKKVRMQYSVPIVLK
jgi:periplasmic protein TonB